MKKETSSALFPLSVNILPGAYLPLQIFEPRYIDMVSECLANSEGFCIVLFKDGVNEENNDYLPHHKIATYVEIVDFNKLDNGLLGITVQGKHKIRIEDVWKQEDDLLLGKIERLKNKLDYYKKTLIMQWYTIDDSEKENFENVILNTLGK